jgi:hypothetical protein
MLPTVEIDNRIMDSIKQTSIDFALKCVDIVADEYNLNKENIRKLLNLQNTLTKKREKKESSSPEPSEEGSITNKRTKEIPLPYVPSMLNENGCNAIVYNFGLFTQCENEPTETLGTNKFCKSCVKETEKFNNLVPKCGTIHQRKAANMFEYKDNRGRKPITYSKVLDKLNVNKDDALDYLKTFNNTELLDQFNFQEQEPAKLKRGRPKKEIIEIVVTDRPIFVPPPPPAEKKSRKEITVLNKKYFVGRDDSEKYKVFNENGDHVGDYNKDESAIDFFPGIIKKANEDSEEEDN